MYVPKCIHSPDIYIYIAVIQGDKFMEAETAMPSQHYTAIVAEEA